MWKSTAAPNPLSLGASCRSGGSPPKLRRGFLMRQRQGLAGKSRAGGALSNSLPSRLLHSPHDNRPIHQTFARIHFEASPPRPRLAPSGFTEPTFCTSPPRCSGNLGGLVPPRCIVQAPRPVSGGGTYAPLRAAQRSPIMSRAEKDALHNGRSLSNPHPPTLFRGVVSMQSGYRHSNQNRVVEI